MADTISTINPSRAVLLVMDYQNGIIDNLDSADELIERMAGTIALARSKGVAVGYVRVAFDDDELAAVPATNKSFSQIASSGRSMQSDSPSTAVHAKLTPQPGDIQVRKIRVGAFSTTDLDKQLKDKGIDTLILGGISTSGVVLSTVRDAADHDYRLLVLEDGCADPDPAVHSLLMEKVFPRQAYVISSGELANLLIAR